jgi:hypothetical protein
MITCYENLWRKVAVLLSPSHILEIGIMLVPIFASKESHL